MGKPTEELALELVPGESFAPSVAPQDYGSNQLDSLLAVIHASTPKDTAEGAIDKAILNNRPSSLGGDSFHGGSPFVTPAGIIVGRLVTVSPQGVAEVDFPGNASCRPLCARTTISLEQKHINQEVALMFENGEWRKPIILGVLQAQGDVPEQGVDQSSSRTEIPLSVQVDGDRLTVTANKELVLKCGKASITLTKAGKIIIRGAYLLSRSSGVNCIKGGSVQIN